MKKILYYTDFSLDEYNSVRDILFAILESPENQNNDQVIVKDGVYNLPIIVKKEFGYKTYKNRNITFFDYIKSKKYTSFQKVKYTIIKSWLHLIRLCSSRFEKRFSKVKFFQKIIQIESPDLVIFIQYTAPKDLAQLCKRRKINYLCVLYDTFIDRPGIDNTKAKKKELYVIKNSIGYFVPSFFYEKYAEVYHNQLVHSYCLPLLVSQKDVLSAYNASGSTRKYKFSYFGQIQSFRNEKQIKVILKKAGIQLDVFSTYNYENDDVFCNHPAVTGNRLNTVVASSDFLVAFDNSFPYQHYLPSKAYLYVSFTKPVIVFGDNDSSALLDFFEQYPDFYYQKLDEPIDGLIEFIQREHDSSFNASLYELYSQYLPINALRELIELINSVKEKK